MAVANASTSPRSPRASTPTGAAIDAFAPVRIADDGALAEGSHRLAEQQTAIDAHTERARQLRPAATELLHCLSRQGHNPVENRQVQMLGEYLLVLQRADHASEPNERDACLRLLDDAVGHLPIEDEIQRVERQHLEDQHCASLSRAQQVRHYPWRLFKAGFMRFVEMSKVVARVTPLRRRFAHGVYDEPGGPYAMYLAKQVYKREHRAGYLALQACNWVGRLVRIGGAFMFLTPVNELSVPIFFVGYAMIRAKQLVYERQAFKVLQEYHGNLRVLALKAGLQQLAPKEGEPRYLSEVKQRRSDVLSALSAISSIFLRSLAAFLPFGFVASILGWTAAAKGATVHGLAKSFVKHVDVTCYKTKVARERALRDLLGTDWVCSKAAEPLQALEEAPERKAIE